jgi:hypothetical protein
VVGWFALKMLSYSDMVVRVYIMVLLATFGCCIQIAVSSSIFVRFGSKLAQ